MELMQASLDGAFPDIPLPNLGSGISRIHLQGVKSVTGLKSENVKMLQGAETAFFYSSLCSALRFVATDVSSGTPELGLSR
jgi:hypothetical protein